MEKKTKALIILVALTIIFTIIGGTLAYFQWSSSNEQKTNVVFTVASGFSCSADGGGSLTSNDVELAPAACTNTTYAIKRTITLHPAITQANRTIYLDMWLKVNFISSNLSESQNFKYALTTSSSNCTTDVVTQGNFWLAEANTQRYLLQDKMYTSTTTETYYLWIWLDSAETNSNTMNQSFNIELGGTCTDNAPVYTANIYDENDRNNTVVRIGKPIPSAITKFYDPNGSTQAMSALEAAYYTVSGGETSNIPIFLKHKTITTWGVKVCDESNNCEVDTFYPQIQLDSQSSCNEEFESLIDNSGGYIYTEENGVYIVTDTVNETQVTATCTQVTVVAESYIGFIVTPTMAANNLGMTAGTYYLTNVFNDDKSTLLSAFGSNNCIDYPRGSYLVGYYICKVLDGLDISIHNVTGTAEAPTTAYMMGNYCTMGSSNSYCEVGTNKGSTEPRPIN